MDKVKIPARQILWETLYDENHNVKQIVTSDEVRSKYFLYNVNEQGALTKIETGVLPVFKKKIF